MCAKRTLNVLSFKFKSYKENSKQGKKKGTTSTSKIYLNQYKAA